LLFNNIAVMLLRNSSHHLNLTHAPKKSRKFRLWICRDDSLLRKSADRPDAKATQKLMQYCDVNCDY